ncbi:MAG: hypothetical protein CSA65_08475 [Proteobacteria bacterium]|nr:MAG: hypothetical protein CSA65_08475 [Pseudomonadota bacterium]
MLSWAVLGVTACTGETPNYCESQEDCASGYYCAPTKTCLPREAGVPDGPGGDATVDAAVDLGARRQDGESCQADSQCKSTFCVDGVCCDKACSGTCQSCVVSGSEGTCQFAAATTDPRGDCKGADSDCDGSCDGSGACLFPGEETSCGAVSCTGGVLTSGACDAKGTCEQRDESCGGFACKNANSCRTTCTLEAHCVAPASCDLADNSCKSAQADGTPCGTNGALCTSGYCVDGVCCASASCPECQACNISGKEGSCQAVIDGKSCGGGTSCAAGTAKVESCVAGSCVATTSPCAPYACNTLGTACAPNCADDTSCASTAYCDTVDSQCKPKRASGETCASDIECQAGLQCTKAEGVCCAIACGGECETCAGKSACTPKAAGTLCGSGDVCTNGGSSSTLTHYACDGSAGTCQSSAIPCGAFTCAASGDACNTSCTQHSHCISTHYCGSSGSCVPKRANGTTCAEDGQCKSGICSTGESVCCDRQCNGECESCSGKAQCTFKAAGTTCAAGETCHDYATESKVESSECDGSSGSCHLVLVKHCLNYKCDTTTTNECLTNCNYGNQTLCASGYTCRYNPISTPIGVLPFYTCD